MKNKIDKKVIRIRAALVFLTMFGIIWGCTLLVNENQKKREQLKAAYTAESTISRVEVQLNRYMAESDLVKKSIEDGLMISDAQFAQLFRLMQDEDYIIKAHEIAKDGIVSQIYPIQGNENAMGFNVLEDSERKKAALLARDSGEYTIAGPFDLVQGGTGVLLFDLVYQTDAQGNEKFWGFSILVMDWEKFIDKMELDKLEDAGYHYQIWKRDNKDNEKVVIAQCVNFEKEDILEVACEVPNDTWYFEIIPENGWITLIQRLWGLLISFMSSFIIMIVYLQFRMRRYREKIHETELEKAVYEAKCANEAKTRFLFNMSHDIRTPINAIIGFADLLEKHIDEKERVRDYIGKIKSSSEFLLSLINYVLETARIESGKTSLKKEVCCASRLIESLTDIFEPEVCKKGLTYSYTKDIEHEYVMGDETKVREIFINIIGNSLKYTPAGGKITIDIREIPFDRENYIAYKIVVEDTGIGMSEDYLPHIFEEFSREHTSTESKVVGTGLGLPIVKALIDLMGGTIEIESEAGKGTKTTVMIPFEIATQEQILEEQQKEKEFVPEDIKEKRMLVAEDNELNAEITLTVLKEKGLLVERAANGKECVEMLKEKPADYYDMILMDIQMPEMDGYQATEMIRNLGDSRAAVPIVAMTANAFEEDRQKALDAGMNAHVSKPVDMHVLFRVMAKFI